jgi:hypothetical protein
MTPNTAVSARNGGGRGKALPVSSSLGAPIARLAPRFICDMPTVYVNHEFLVAEKYRLMYPGVI